MIDIKDISYGYGSQPVLNNLSFSIKKGEFFGIVGPNGSGKSTLLRIIAGIIRPKLGEVIIKGKRVESYTRKELAKTMAVLPQEEQLPFAFTVREVISMGRYPHQKGLFPNINDRERKLIDEVLLDLNLKAIENQSIHHLSGGQKQRVLLARILVQEPELVLLDEPTNHLDICFQLEILNHLNKWRELLNITVISVLHDLNLTALYSDRVLLLNSEGRVTALGDVQQTLTSSIVTEVFGAPTLQITHPLLPKPQFILIPKI